MTLDGNEQYTQAEQFDVLVDAIRKTPQLGQLWKNVLAVEQPLDRAIALEEFHTEGIRRLSASTPVIIDESDETLDSYPRALELGYRGVSTKSCKGPIKSLLNAGLTWLRNERGKATRYMMTAEDLCTVGVIPLQADLCLVAALGLSHAERNGHHFHPGLSYLSPAQQAGALASHGDLYERVANVVSPKIVDGQFQLGSLQCPGFGFSALPDMGEFVPAARWQFSSLGLHE